MTFFVSMLDCSQPVGNGNGRSFGLESDLHCLF